MSAVFTTIFRELLRKNYRMVKIDGYFNLQENLIFDYLANGV